MRKLTTFLFVLALPFGAAAQKSKGQKPAAALTPTTVPPPSVPPSTQPVTVPVAPAAAPVDPPTPAGFNKYYFVTLLKGPKRDQDQATLRNLAEQHLDYMEKMATERKILFDGTMMDGGDFRGFMLVKAATIADAKQLAEEDAMVKAGRVAVEVHPFMTESDVLEKGAAEVPAPTK